MRRYSILFVLFVFLYGALYSQEPTDDETKHYQASASSADKNHPENLPLDGREDTWWQPDADDNSPEWILDLGKKQKVMELDIVFLKENAYLYIVEVSDDKINWRTVSDMRSYNLVTKSLTLTGNTKEGRYIRIKFDKPTPKPQITKVETCCFDVDE